MVDSARVRPVLVVPRCNFWDRDRKLGRDELLTAITAHHRALGGRAEQVELAFRGPKNHALILLPPPEHHG